MKWEMILLTSLMLSAVSFAAEPARKPARKPVLIELFTSEGCSSCPPADAQLETVARTQPYAGVQIIPLAWHVDYWNRPWVDPFSIRQSTARQREYGDRFQLNSVYTPQMVADGKSEFIGGDKNAFDDAIKQAADAPKGQIEITPAAVGDVHQLRVAIRASNLPATSKDNAGEVFLLITEDALRVAVKRGENGGSTLRHSGVVRFVRKIGQTAPDAPERFDGAATITLDPSWRREHLNVVAFVQAHAHGQIIAAASVPIPDGAK